MNLKKINKKKSCVKRRNLNKKIINKKFTK